MAHQLASARALAAGAASIPFAIALLGGCPGTSPAAPAQPPAHSVPATAPSSAEPPASSAGHAAIGAPSIAFDTEMHDFGTILDAEKVSTVFVVRNTGTAPLVIDRVRTSCGCTASAIESKEIPPGGESRIDVTFDPAGRVGPQRKTVTVSSNDPAQPNRNLEIKAVIQPRLAFTPSLVRLNVSYGEATDTDTWLTGVELPHARLAIKSMEGDHPPKVKVTSKKEGDAAIPGLRFSLRGTRVTSGTGQVVVATGVEAVPELTVKMTWNVMGNLELRPRSLFFDSRSTGGEERMIRVVSRREDLKIKSVRVASGPYQATFAPATTGPGYEVKVVLDRAAAVAGGDLSGKLVIATNDPQEPTVEVPLAVRQMPRLVMPMPAPAGSGSAAGDRAP